MSRDVIERYTALTNTIEDWKEKIARLEGRMESLQKDLEHCGFKSVEQAAKWLGKAQEEYNQATDAINDRISEAEEIIRGIEE